MDLFSSSENVKTSLEIEVTLWKKGVVGRYAGSCFFPWVGTKYNPNDVEEKALETDIMMHIWLELFGFGRALNTRH